MPCRLFLQPVFPVHGTDFNDTIHHLPRATKACTVAHFESISKNASSETYISSIDLEGSGPVA
jgi:hypothetical protein